MASYGAGRRRCRVPGERGAGKPAGREGIRRRGCEVTLITLHNTKGLEFDRVIITGLEEGIFPHDSSAGRAEDLEEERRLFYVGITRARERLVMTWCLSRRIFGRTTDMAPSRFLDEIPEESRAEDRGGATGQRPMTSTRWAPACSTTSTAPAWWRRTWYTDGALLVQVRFQSGRVAKFLPKYARLERITSDE